ncbi:MAG TPA: GAF domain-containing sensor histidine kinase [Thermoanaerobaculia bacterium]|nr:GAF domain-containing sensor histidine kinase [Thermoanaerobaculia bacterium]
MDTRRAPAPQTTPGSVTDPERLAALEASGLLDTAPEAAFDRLTRLAARLLDAPVALVSLVDDRRQFFKSCVGLSGLPAVRRETPLSHSFCQYVTGGVPLIVEDAREHPLVKDNLAIEDLGVVAYAGFPVRDTQGRTLGSFCVIDTEPRQWSDDELEILEDLASSVATEVRLRQALTRSEERADTAERVAGELRRAEASLRRALQARDEIAAVVSHDLRNPLNAIAMAVGLLHAEAPGASGVEHLAKIERAVERMSRLIRDLVDITKVEHGSLDLEIEPVPAAELIDAACGELADSAEASGVRLDGHTDEGLVVQVDRHRILQVLSNLLANALRHTPEGGRVEVTATVHQGEAAFAVNDTGCGLSAEELDRVFDRFWRGGERRGEGAGLGLAIAQGIVEAHGGRIEAESKEGEGALFRFTVGREEETPAPSNR